MSIALARTELAGFIRELVAGRDLTLEQARLAVSEILREQPTPAQVAAFLTALAVKGETAAELAGAALALRERCVAFNTSAATVVDVCGTGGDGSGSFNISTAAAFVVAGAGQSVAKHGNRAMSSRCGSADVLEALGVNVTLPAERAAQILNRHGIVFLFAQHYHPTTRHVSAVRREIGVRTIFNLVGPLCNPARPTHQVVGVAKRESLEVVATALQSLGCVRGAVVHSADGLDEISLAATTDVLEWDGRAQRQYTIDPAEFGLGHGGTDSISGGSALENARHLRNVLDGMAGARTEIVMLNAALALHVCGAAANLHDGLKQARHSIESGAARTKLQQLIAASVA